MGGSVARPGPDAAGRPWLGRGSDGGGALALEPAEAIRTHITGQIAALGAAPAPTEET
jgi:hypothetical protein